jgi:hypothetical protein
MVLNLAGMQWMALLQYYGEALFQYLAVGAATDESVAATTYRCTSYRRTIGTATPEKRTHLQALFQFVN